MQVVFVGPFEHHSNLLPWREVGATVVWIQENAQGLADIDDLEEKLEVSTHAHADLNLISSGPVQQSLVEVPI